MSEQDKDARIAELEAKLKLIAESPGVSSLVATEVLGTIVLSGMNLRDVVAVTAGAVQSVLAAVANKTVQQIQDCKSLDEVKQVLNELKQ